MAVPSPRFEWPRWSSVAASSIRSGQVSGHGAGESWSSSGTGPGMTDLSRIALRSGIRPPDPSPLAGPVMPSSPLAAPSRVTLRPPHPGATRGHGSLVGVSTPPLRSPFLASRVVTPLRFRQPRRAPGLPSRVAPLAATTAMTRPDRLTSRPSRACGGSVAGDDLPPTSGTSRGHWPPRPPPSPGSGATAHLTTSSSLDHPGPGPGHAFSGRGPAAHRLLYR